MRKSLLLIFILLAMCKAEPEAPPILEQAIFVQVYCDVVVQGDRLPPHQRSAFADSILANNSMTREMFEQTVQYYSQDPERWQLVFKEISKELDSRITNNNPTTGKTARPKAPAPPNTQKTIPANPKTIP